MLTLEPFSNDQGRSAVQPTRGSHHVSFLMPHEFTHPSTRTHVRLLGPCFKTGRMGSPQVKAWSTRMARHVQATRASHHDQGDDMTTCMPTTRDLIAAMIRFDPRHKPTGRPVYNRSTCGRGASSTPIRFPPDNFKHSLTLFSKSFSSFPRGTCSLSISRPYLALDGTYRRIWAAFPNNPTHRQRLMMRQGSSSTGLSPSPTPHSKGLKPGPPPRTLPQTTIRMGMPFDYQAGPLPFRSPLLGESL